MTAYPVTHGAVTRRRKPQTQRAPSDEDLGLPRLDRIVAGKGSAG